MGVLGTVLLVVFVIVCLLLVLLVAIQGDEENGMGGLLGGRGTAAFGSHSASVLTKTTCVLVILFFVLAIGLAFVNRGNTGRDTVLDDVEQTTEETETTTNNENWWIEAETTDNSTVVEPAVENAESVEAAETVTE